jgi:hypothetical protein
MRSLLLSFTAMTVLAAAPAFAQGGVQRYADTGVPAGTGRVVTGPPDLPSVQPLSHRDSNINASDTRTKIAPALPSPGVGPDAPASEFLRAAANALASGQTGRAQEALEDAETQLLSRSMPADMIGQPDQNPAVGNIHSALQALGSHDPQRAMQIVQQTIAMVDQMQQTQYGGAPMAPMAGGGPTPYQR